MKLQISQIHLKKTVDRVQLLQGTHFALLVGAFVVVCIEGGSIMLMLLKLTLLASFYRFYYKTLKEYNYTFWTFTIIAIIFCAFSFISSAVADGTDIVSYFYLMAVVLIITQIYYLFTPLFYPTLNWWEYDYRLIKDLKISVRQNETITEARLSDIRRGAACLTSFESFELGAEIDCLYDDMFLRGQIQTSRENLFGRGVQYGIAFDMTDWRIRGLFEQTRREWLEGQRRDI